MRKVQFAVKLLPLAPLHPASPPLGRQISELLFKQRAAALDAPRLLYGRDDANLPLTPHHIGMNAAALELLQANPWLVKF